VATVVRLQVDKLRLDHPETVEKLIAFDNADFGMINGVTVMNVYVAPGTGVVETAVEEARRLTHLTGATAVRVYPDLVSASAIAERVGVSREAVRKWVARVGSPFPPPYGVVGEGMRVWRWVEVLDWLRATRAYHADEQHPSILELAQIDACLARVPDSTSVDWASVPTETHQLTLHLGNAATRLTFVARDSSEASPANRATLASA